MTEKEKAGAGLLYDANYDPALMEERAKAAALCFALNQTHPAHREKHRAIIRQLTGSCGENFVINPPFWCDYGYNIAFGDNFFVNFNCVILDAAQVTFGHNVFIAPNCGFYTAGHPLDSDQRNRGLEYAYPITIADNVWIGGNCVFMPGVSVGAGSVIGAGSVVTRDIPEGVVAVGNPCRPLRAITEEDRRRYDRPRAG